jgi:hypothetical protein
VRTPGCLIAVSLIAGCRLNPAFLEERGATESDAGVTSDGGTRGSTGDGTGTGSDTGAETGSDTSDGSTGDLACTYQSLGEVHAAILVDGQEQGTCGDPYESWGIIAIDGVGDLSFQPCSDTVCTNCINETVELQVSGPAGSVPTQFADCSRVRVEREFIDPTSQSCVFSGVVLSSLDNAQVVVPYFIGSSKVVHPPEGLTLLSQQLTVGEKTVETCDCTDCCNGTALEYELEFMLGNVNEFLPPLGTAFSTVAELEFKLSNLQSHDALVCGEPPAIDWTIVDTAFLG